MRILTLLTTALCLLATGAACCADTPTAASKLAGLWGNEQIFGPTVKGMLVVDMRVTPWQAEVAGFSVPVKHLGDDVSFALPGDEGEFRGRMERGRLLGDWIQPATVVNGVPYATPLQLDRTEPGVWQGAIHPLEDRLSLYLVLQPAADGTLRGFIRNPERNYGMGRAYQVSLDGGHITLTDTRRASDMITGIYDPGTDSLSFTLPDFGPIVFTRRARDTAPGFYPVTPAVTHYLYREPVTDDDGWKTASLSEVGLDPVPLSALIQKILDTPTDGYTAPYIQGLLVARHGKLALEQYFYGFDRERTHDTRSSAKTLTGTLVGIALDHGAKFTLDTPVYSLFPQYTSFAHPDPRKEKITVADLLSMDSGYACDDNDDASPGNEDTMQNQDAQPDWYKYVLDLPMMDTPGDGQAVYCTGGINLLGGILRSTVHMPLTEFFREYYARPMDISVYHMNLMPDGDAYMGGGIYLRPRDMLKLGQLYLGGGTWNGRRVVSENWVRLATAQHSAFPASDYAPGHGYGYTWHLHDLASGGRTYHAYAAEGNGGQLVIVIPELDMVVMFTAGNYNNFPTWRKFYEELVPQYIIPAATH